MNDDMIINNPANISVVIDSLCENFTKYKNSDNKKEIIKGCIDNEDIPKVISALIDKNLDEIVIYILDHFSFMKNSDSYSEIFFTSIKNNKFTIVESLIKNEYVNHVEARDQHGNSGLLLATVFSNIQISKLLIKNASELLEIKNKYGIDPLTVSVYNNDNLMFFLLVTNLKYSIFNVNELCKLAIRNENYEILSHLTSKTANYLEDPLILHHACTQKSTEIFKLVLSLVNVFNFTDSNGETALHWAVLRGTYHIVELMIKKLKEHHLTIDPKSKFGITPFQMALLKQDKNVVQLLFEAGADINELDTEGNSIIHMISAIGDLKWLKYVIKHFNANSYQKNNKGNTPFAVAIINHHYEIVNFFIDKIPSLNWKNKYGQTPLHAAVFVNDIKLVELLLNNKADITVTDINDLTPYHYAYIDKKVEMIKVIHNILKVENFLAI